jgi:signal peptide peptidase SppA
MKERALLLSKIFNAPLAIEPAKLQVILHVLQPQLDLDLSGLSLIEGEPPKQFLESQKSSLPQPAAGTGIAVVEIMGSLVHRARGMQAESGLQSYEAIGDDLKMLRQDSRIGGILLRMDSPGGEVAGVYELARIVRETAQIKPVWTLVDGMGLSAGYLIASQTNRILLTTNAAVGSVGVIMIHLDQSKADEQRGLKFTVLKRGAHKDDFNPHAPLSDSALQFADRMLDDQYDRFIEQAAQGRRLPEKKLRATEASIFYDEAAIGLGLADAQTNFEDAVGEMSEHLAQANTVRSTGGTLMAESTALPAPPPASPPATQAEPLINAVASVVTNGVSASDLKEIALLCKMARRPHLTTQYITEGKTVAEVRELLLADESALDSESEVYSAFAGQAGVAQSLISAKPKLTLAQLMRKRVGLQEAR